MYIYIYILYYIHTYLHAGVHISSWRVISSQNVTFPLLWALKSLIQSASEPIRLVDGTIMWHIPPSCWAQEPWFCLIIRVNIQRSPEIQKLLANISKQFCGHSLFIPSNKLEWIQPSLWMEEIWDSPYWRLRIAGTYQPWMVENFVVSRQQAKYRPWVWDPLEIDCLQRFAPFFPFLGVTMVYPLVIQHSLCATAISRWFTCWKWWFP